MSSPSFAVVSLSAEVTNIAAALKEALSGVVTDTQELAVLTVETDLLVAQASTLVRQPSNIASAFTDVIRKLPKTIASYPLGVVKALMDVYATPAVADAVGSTATRVQERANQAALSAVLRQAFVIEAARLLPLVEFATLADALTERAIVVDALDAQANTATDAAYPGLMTLRASLTLAVPGDSFLARIQTIERPVPVPSLLLSYQLYGTVDQQDDVTARNTISHPGFIGGSLQVLSDG